MGNPNISNKIIGNLLKVTNILDIYILRNISVKRNLIKF